MERSTNHVSGWSGPRKITNCAAAWRQGVHATRSYVILNTTHSVCAGLLVRDCAVLRSDMFVTTTRVCDANVFPVCAALSRTLSRACSVCVALILWPGASCRAGRAKRTNGERNTSGNSVRRRQWCPSGGHLRMPVEILASSLCCLAYSFSII